MGADGGRRSALLVPEPEGTRVLAAIGGVAATPPTIDLPDTWWVGHVPELLDAMRAQLDLNVSVVDVRTLGDDRFVTAVTAPASSWQPAEGTAWVDRDELHGTEIDLFDREPSAAPWLRPGWLTEAQQWIDDQLAALGRRRTGEVVQLKHWSIGTLLRVPAAPHDVVYKEVPSYFAHEAPIVSVLGDLVPGAVPDAIAEDGCRWLMETFTEDHPDGAAHPDYDGALRAVAQLQMAAVDQVARLQGAGAPSRSLPGLADELQALLQRADVDEVFPGEHRGAFEEALPELTGRCHALEALGLPPTISHGDLHQWNVTRHDGRWLVFDWTDSSISVPLLDLCPWLWHMDRPEDRRRATDAYLDEWSAIVDPSTLREAWRLAGPLAAAFYAMDYVTLLDGVDPWHQGMWRGAIGVWMDRALTALRAERDG